MTTTPGDLALLLSLLLTAYGLLYGGRLVAVWGAARYAADDAGSGRWKMR